IHPISQLFHQLPLAGNIVIKKQKHQLQDHHRINRNIARTSIAIANRRHRERKVQQRIDLTQWMICADAVFQIDTIGEEALLLLSWILAEHSNQTIEQPFLFNQLSKLLSWAPGPYLGCYNFKTRSKKLTRY